MSYIDEDVVPVTEGLFIDFFGFSEASRVEGFLAFWVCHSGDQSSYMTDDETYLGIGRYLQ